MARTRHRNRARAGSPLNLPGAFQLFKPSRDIILKNIWIFGPLYAVSLIFSIHTWLWAPTPGTGKNWVDHFDSFSSGWSFAPTSTFTWSAFVGLSVFWFTFVLVVGTIVQIMSQAAQLDAVEQRPLDFQILWRVVRKLGLRMLGLYVIVGLCVAIGLILLIIPGLIMMRRYFLAPYVMIEKECGIKEAMDRSAKMTKPHAGSIYSIIGVSFLLALTAVVPFVGSLIAFILAALYSAAPALRYDQLKGLS